MNKEQMGGIYIPHRKMPKDCWDCFVRIERGPFPACALAKDYREGKALVLEACEKGARPFGCPLLVVAPHRTLKDADELLAALHLYRNRLNSRFAENEVTACMNRIREAPTVIPADEEGEA